MVDIAIVGGGPVGLCLALLLSKTSIFRVCIFEKESQPNATSRAIGIMPSTLSLFKSLNILDEMLAAGVQIQTVEVWNHKRALGEVSFEDLGGAFPFILSIPQAETERILQKAVDKCTRIDCVKGVSVTDFKTIASKHILNLSNGKTREFDWVCACDGAHSRLRELLEMPAKKRRFRDTFLMGDFIDKTDYGQRARLFFTKWGAVESFPLPHGIRRWIVQTNAFSAADPNVLCDLVLKRSGVRLNVEDNRWVSPFGVQTILNKTFYKQGVFFCGDAAHTMSPIGGQGMNTGFSDAEFVAGLLQYCFNLPWESPVFLNYTYYRKIAAEAAIRRAWVSMRIGTLTGPLSWSRDRIISGVLNTSVKKFLPPHFAMLTIPYGTLNDVLKADTNLQEIIK